jgi:uncharacterized membrane protein
LVPTRRNIALVGASILYVTAGVLHFRYPNSYVRIVPPFIPARLAMVYVSGAAEIAGGIGLLLPYFRRAAAWGLIALLIAVLPANVYMAMDRVAAGQTPAWILWARLPLQLVLIWWVLRCSGR